jgi:hypothetical protein
VFFDGIANIFFSNRIDLEAFAIGCRVWYFVFVDENSVQRLFGIQIENTFDRRSDLESFDRSLVFALVLVFEVVENVWKTIVC